MATKTTILTTEEASSKAVNYLLQLRVLLDSKKREKVQLEVTTADVKETLQDIDMEWDEFDKVQGNGLLPFKVVDSDSGEVLLEASKCRASKSYNLPNFMQEVMIAVGYRKREAEDCLTMLEESGILDVLSVATSNLRPELKAILEKHTRTEHSGARSYK